jgi:hypothetical protein
MMGVAVEILHAGHEAVLEFLFGCVATIVHAACCAKCLMQPRRRLLQESHLMINAHHLGHLLGKVGIALFQVVSHFVRLHLVLAMDLAHRALRQIGEAVVPLPVRARERGRPEIASSKVRRDSRGPWSSGTPAPPAMPWRSAQSSVLGRGESDRRAPPSGLRPRRVRRSAGPSDDAARAPELPQKKGSSR